MSIPLPKWLRDRLGSCPHTGDGVNDWLFTTARQLHHFCPDKEVLAELLEAATANCGREVPDREIWRAINNSQRTPEGRRGAAPSGPGRPKRNDEMIASITKEGPSLAGLEAMSPVPLTAESPRAEEIVTTLFPGNPLICVGETVKYVKCAPVAKWCHFLLLRQMQFIVPSPMSAPRGKRKEDGKLSVRTEDNTGPRRFLVVEFDQGNFDEHAALLTHLARYAPLALVVHSGNKSLHGWLYCAGQPEEKVLRFFRYAVTLGADPPTWSRNQLVRMPDGLRDNGKRQRVVYFNPQILEAK